MVVVRRVWPWLADHPFVISLVIVVAAVAVMQWENQNQDRRERLEDKLEVVQLAAHDARTECLTNNEARLLIREIGVELSEQNAEALIAVVGADADATEVARYRAFVTRNAQNTVSRLEARDCKAEVIEAVETTAAIQDLPIDSIPPQFTTIEE